MNKSLIYFLIPLILSSCSDFKDLGLINIDSDTKTVSKLEFQTQGRVNDLLNSDIFYPSDKDGNLVELNKYDIIISVQGGLVKSERYDWLTRHLASKGYIVISPKHLLDLAFFEVDNSYLILNSFLEKYSKSEKLKKFQGKKGKIVIIGHSLGGVVAAYQWQRYPEINGLILLASYPDEKSDISNIKDKPVLSITGSNDKKSLPEKVRKGFDSIKSQKVLAEVQGMNHYAWTDNFTQEELKSDGIIEGNLTNLRNTAFNVIDAWLDYVFSDNTQSLNKLKQNSIAGVKIISE